MRRPCWGGRAAALIAAVAAPLLLSGFAVAEAAEQRQGPERPVVLVGVPGLKWEEVSAETTPHLWGLAESSAVGNMSIRTVTSRTCPVDGWLTVSAGQRAYSERQEHFICELPASPEIDGDGAVVPEHDEHVSYNLESAYSARVGLLADTVHESGGSALAVGPGAALAAADSDGRVDSYAEEVADVAPEQWDAADLTVVDLDDLAALYLDPPVAPDIDIEETEVEEEREEPEPDPIGDSDRVERLRAIDDQLGEVLAAVPDSAAVVVAGVSVEAGPSHLNTALLYDPAAGGTAEGGGFVTSESTRRAGLVALTDTSVTLLSAMELNAPSAMVGRTWMEVPHSKDTSTVVAELADADTAAQVVQSLMVGFFSWLVTVQLLIYGAAAYVLHRYGRQDRSRWHRVLNVTRAVALAGASFPVASYLANLVPWWQSPYPRLAMMASVLTAAAAVAALAIAGPWRRDILGPVAVVSGVTAAVLFIDTATGTNLQMNALTGYTALVAGRFYGVGNIALATFSTGVLMFIACLAYYLIGRGHRRTAVLVATAIGAASVFVVGWPGLGTSFGGTIALVPGLAVTVLMIAGRRITLPRFAGITGGGLLLVSGLAYLDLRRPPEERSHFGMFAAQVLDGESGTVLLRKLSAMLGTLGNWQLTLLAACALLFLFLVLNNPTNWRAGTLQRAYEYAPTLRAGLTGTMVTALVGFAANDSGVAIPALALTVAVPLTLAACTWVLQREAAAPEGPGDAAEAAPESAPQRR